MFAPPASGSAAPTAMVVMPCSMGMAGRLASGTSDDLIERAADVTLKEGRPLLLVPRETPLSTIHLENLLRLARAGARIVPAMPAFYQQPQSMADLVDFVVGKVLDGLGMKHELYRRWGG
jgi:4-hydroxy-3-polyprenylbenzoate decarboxylase